MKEYLLVTGFFCMSLFSFSFAQVFAADAAGPGCRINEGPCSGTVRDTVVSLEISPRPVRTMRELLFAVSLRTGGRDATPGSVTIDLAMPGMVMGRNRILLKRQAGGRYEGKGVIVRCPSGGKAWKATIEIRQGNNTAMIPFLFEVE